MKLQIRRCVFETNSSSTHSISISKKIPDVKTFPNFIRFSGGEFGWEIEEYTSTDEKLSYLFTALQYVDDGVKLFEKIKTYLDEAGVKYEIDSNYIPTSESKGKVSFKDGCWYYIDHGNKLTDFVRDIANDKDLFYSFVFGDSSVFTGNDNEDMVYYGSYDCFDEQRKGDDYYHYFKGN